MWVSKVLQTLFVLASVGAVPVSMDGALIASENPTPMTAPASYTGNPHDHPDGVFGAIPVTNEQMPGWFIDYAEFITEARGNGTVVQDGMDNLGVRYDMLLSEHCRVLHAETAHIDADLINVTVTTEITNLRNIRRLCRLHLEGQAAEAAWERARRPPSPPSSVIRYELNGHVVLLGDVSTSSPSSVAAVRSAISGALGFNPAAIQVAVSDMAPLGPTTSPMHRLSFSMTYFDYSNAMSAGNSLARDLGTIESAAHFLVLANVTVVQTATLWLVTRPTSGPITTTPIATGSAIHSPTAAPTAAPTVAPTVGSPTAAPSIPCFSVSSEMATGEVLVAGVSAPDLGPMQRSGHPCDGTQRHQWAEQIHGVPMRGTEQSMGRDAVPMVPHETRAAERKEAELVGEQKSSDSKASREPTPVDFQ